MHAPSEHALQQNNGENKLSGNIPAINFLHV